MPGKLRGEDIELGPIAAVERRLRLAARRQFTLTKTFVGLVMMS